MRTVDEIQQRLEEEIKNRINAIVSAVGSNPDLLVMHGTTDLAMVYNHGVLVASDGRASAGNMIVTEKFSKILRLDSHSLAAIAGSPSIGAEIVNILRAQLMFEFDNTETHSPPKSKLNMVIRMVKRFFPLAISRNMVAMIIFATYDLDEREPGGRVFSIWPDGMDKPETDFECIGSGGPTANAVIQHAVDFKRTRSRDLNFNDVKYIAAKALYYANLYDAGTGRNVYMQYITKTGISRVPSEEVLSIMRRINRRRAR